MIEIEYPCANCLFIPTCVSSCEHVNDKSAGDETFNIKWVIKNKVCRLCGRSVVIDRIEKAPPGEILLDFVIRISCTTCRFRNYIRKSKLRQIIEEMDIPFESMSHLFRSD